MKNNLFKLAALVVCILLLVSAGFADKGKKVMPSKASPVKEKPKESGQKEQPKPGIITPTQISPKEDQPAKKISPVELPQTQVLSASAVRDKGRQISWQIVCTGGNCGSSAIAYWLGGQNDGFHLCGTAGQVAVGTGSSESFGMNSGFWQEFLQGYLRGDVNGDGVIELGDVVYLINYLYREGPAPDPLWTGDCNCDEIVELGDVVYLINYLYRSGPPPSC